MHLVDLHVPTSPQSLELNPDLCSLVATQAKDTAASDLHHCTTREGKQSQHQFKKNSLPVLFYVSGVWPPSPSLTSLYFAWHYLSSLAVQQWCGLVHHVVCLCTSPDFTGYSYTYPQRDAPAELTWVPGCVPMSLFTNLKWSPIQALTEKNKGFNETGWKSWFRGAVVECWSLAGKLSLSCARNAADG